MRLARKQRLVTGLLVALTMLSVQPVVAQTVDIEIDVDASALSTALDLFSKRTGIGVVYAERIVEGVE